MKKYKVGDTIYLKGTVGAIDDTTLPYCVDFVNDNTVWITSDNIIDELPTAEPVKPVLPKKVGEELDIAKNELQISFDVYIGNVIASISSAKASYHYYIVNTNAIIKLADAWRYGYTVEKPKQYGVWVPHVKGKMYYKDGRGSDGLDIASADCLNDKNQRFTLAEIEHYGLQDCEREELTDDDD